MAAAPAITQLQGHAVSPGDWVVPLLERVDTLLALAVQQLNLGSPIPDAGSPIPGLFITAADVGPLLRRPPASSPYLGSTLPHPWRSLGDLEYPPWSHLKDVFGLDEFDLNVLALAMCVELDLKYQRIFAWLQDDLARLRPTVDLILNLFCPHPEDRIRGLSHFDDQSPLVRHGLVSLNPDPQQNVPPRLAFYVVPDLQIVDFVLRRSTLNNRLATVGKLVPPSRGRAQAPINGETRRGIERVIDVHRQTARSVRVHLPDLAGCGPMSIARWMSAEFNQPFLIIDLESIASNQDSADADLRVAVRYAMLHHCVLMLDGFTRLDHDVRRWLSRLAVERLAGFRGLAILDWTPDFQAVSSVEPNEHKHIVVEIDLPAIDTASRASIWRSAIADTDVDLGNPEIDLIANRYRLRPDQIRSAVDLAEGAALWHGHEAATIDTLMSAARRQSRSSLHRLARTRTPDRDWGDIVLPDDQRAQLREICDHAEYRHIVHHQWSRASHTSTAEGVNVLFSGPSGTGKTLAAEIIASELELELATINIAHTVSKYIGETEKNLDVVFEAAEESNAVLFFDEADAIFGKRSQVKDAHDRYANLEVGYLLQRIEAHDGIVILGTNLRSNMDDAFTRRLHHVVEFPFPDASLRRQIWQMHLHEGVAQAGDIDLPLLAHQFEIAGGSIRSIVVNATVFAAAQQQPVSMLHIIRATRREFQKMGRVCDEHAFGETMRWLESPVADSVTS